MFVVPKYLYILYNIYVNIFSLIYNGLLIYFFHSTFMTEFNYIGAVSAYSHGIKLSPKMAVLYLNRSKAHIQIKNYHKAVEDATTVCFYNTFISFNFK